MHLGFYTKPLTVFRFQMPFAYSSLLLAALSVPVLAQFWHAAGPLARRIFRASWGLPYIISLMGEACSRSRSWTRSRNRSRSGSSNRSRSRKSKRSSRARGASAGEGAKVATPANATSPAEQEEH